MRAVMQAKQKKREMGRSKERADKITAEFGKKSVGQVNGKVGFRHNITTTPPNRVPSKVASACEWTPLRVFALRVRVVLRRTWLRCLFFLKRVVVKPLHVVDYV